MTALSQAADTWFRRYRPPAAGTRLVCFPHAGGSAAYYRPLALRLESTVDALVVQYPGRQDRRAEPNVPRIDVLADRIAAAVREVADRPLAFFGHSMGAVLAFEVTLRLGPGAVTHLFASGRRAPTRYRPEAIHKADDASLLAEVERLDGTASVLLRDPEFIDMILPGLRNDYIAIETYRHRPGALVDCPITALVGDTDPRTSVSEARDWASSTSGAFALHVLRGGHFYLADQAAEVAATICATLAPAS
ncbi:thioesterase II family protein [Dactylosporangium sp. CA-233914]|uniref:thioesterase II family protein n=1 Tax=Dactylosporangium sp. CA-233914 TaxID=3239934 RepID=UPI003D8D5158